MGTVVPMAKVEGSWIWLHTVPMMIIYKRMRITGRFKGYFLSVHMANLSATG